MTAATAPARLSCPVSGRPCGRNCEQSPENPELAGLCERLGFPPMAPAAGAACQCWHYPVRLHERHCCFTDGSLCHPVPEDMREDVLARLRAAWDEPFTAGPADEKASRDRAQLARYLADVILCSPPRTAVGGLIIVSAGWSKERGDYADSVADSATDPQGWIAALGRHETAVLTSDGQTAARTGWCACTDAAGPGSQVRYEAWSERGCEAHGFVCAGCRKLTQTG